MRKISDYLKHAEECDALALTADTPEHAEALRRMAATWRELASARNREIQRGIRMKKQERETDD